MHFHAKADWAASPHAAARLGDVTMMSRAVLRPGAAAQVRIPAGLDMLSISHRGSVVAAVCGT